MIFLAGDAVCGCLAYRLQVALEKLDIVVACAVVIGILWELHVDVIEIAEGEADSICLGHAG